MSHLHLPAIDTLKKGARGYAKSECDAARLVERTLQVIADDPSLLDGPDIDEALLHVLHHVAQQDFRPT